MGISRSSFYAAFTVERNPYIECLDLFSARALDLLQRDRTAMPPVDALQNFASAASLALLGAGVAGARSAGAASARRATTATRCAEDGVLVKPT